MMPPALMTAHRDYIADNDNHEILVVYSDGSGDRYVGEEVGQHLFSSDQSASAGAQPCH